MSTINLSGYAIPQLVDNEFVFNLLGEKASSSNFSYVLTRDDLERTIGSYPLVMAESDEDEETEDDDSSAVLTIMDAFELYFYALLGAEYTPEHPINDHFGKIVRYVDKNSKQPVTLFQAGGIYIDSETNKPVFVHGDDESAKLMIPLQPKVSNGPFWGIPSATIVQQGVIEQTNKTTTGENHVVFLSASVNDPETEELHQIHFWINAGIPRQKGQKTNPDAGNIKGAERATKAFSNAKLTDFSGCLLPKPKGFSGLKTDLSMIFSGYYELGLRRCALKITEVMKETIEKKDGSGSFPQYSVKINVSVLPQELNVKAFDFTRPLPTGGYHSQLVNICQIGYIQMPANQIRMKCKLAEQPGTDWVLPSEENPWILMITEPPGGNQKNPKHEIWRYDYCPDYVRQALEASKSIAVFGGSSIDIIIDAQRSENRKDFDFGSFQKGVDKVLVGVGPTVAAEQDSFDADDDLD